MSSTQAMIVALLLAAVSRVGIAAEPARMQWKIGDVMREALVFAPDDVSGEPRPLTFAFHGHGGNMILVAFMAGREAGQASGEDRAPTVHDPRLQLTMICESPQIMTPIGSAIDAQDRLFVLESHTHERPRDYDGPASNRVMMFTDADEDGRFASGGDPESGRRVFHSPHATCANCHTTGGLGGTRGPDLSNVAQSVDRNQIIHSILRPSDQFPPQYQAWMVMSSDGQTHVGLQLDHKAGGNIEMITADGQSKHYAADDIEAYRASNQSLMPSGLEQNLSVHEFRDLVAYLESLK